MIIDNKFPLYNFHENMKRPSTAVVVAAVVVAIA